MRSLYVPLAEEVLQRLGRLARQERRHPKDEAAILLERAIEAVEEAPTPRVPRLFCDTHEPGDDAA